MLLKKFGKLNLLLSFYFFSGGLLIVFIESCDKQNTKNNYMFLIEELHNIECDQLNKNNVTFDVNEKNIYGFRSVAFDLLMTKNPNGALIQRYEDLSHKLAVIEHYIDENEKKEYYETYNEIYTKDCHK